MSMDRSLKSASSLVRHRNVLTRGERMVRLTEQDKFPAGRSILGLPKVANRKMSVGKAPKAEAVEGAVAAAPAAKGAKGAKGAVAAAPAAKGAKGAAAPAAKGAKGAPAAKAAPAAKKK